MIIRSKDATDAVVRLHSDPLVTGSGLAGLYQARVVHPDQVRKADFNADLILYHYDDRPAIARLADGSGTGGALIGALGADIYDVDEYRRLCLFTDLFLMPTRLHARMLSSLIFKPVFLLGECIDTVSGYGHNAHGMQQRHPGGRTVLWFGYPESFHKSMDTVLPVLCLAREQGLIDSIHIISDRAKLPIVAGIAVTPFSADSFSDLAAKAHYAVLSHIPGDLRINTFIKSPNKAITAIMAGLVPIASATPNYEELFLELGIGRMLFDSPARLLEILASADYDRDHAEILNQGVIDRIAASGCSSRMAQRLAAAFNEVRSGTSPVADLMALPHADPKSSATHVGRLARIRSLIKGNALAISS